MKKELVRSGMKVVPHSKSVWGILEDSNSWNIAKKIKQDYLFVIKWNYEEQCFILSEEQDDEGGDFFNPEDFEPYKLNIKQDAWNKILDVLSEEHVDKVLQLINKFTDSNFNEKSSIQDVLNKLSEKWKTI